MTKKRRRCVHLHVMVTPEEQKLIGERMAEAGISNMGAYIRKMRFTFAVQFRYARFPLFFRQAFVCADVLHLLLDSLFAVFEAHSVLQCTQPLDVLCVKNHVCGGFNVTVKPF